MTIQNLDAYLNEDWSIFNNKTKFNAKIKSKWRPNVANRKIYVFQNDLLWDSFHVGFVFEGCWFDVEMVQCVPLKLYVCLQDVKDNT